jgi:hypothetical protein
MASPNQNSILSSPIVIVAYHESAELVTAGRLDRLDRLDAQPGSARCAEPGAMQGDVTTRPCIGIGKFVPRHLTCASVSAVGVDDRDRETVWRAALLVSGEEPRGQYRSWKPGRIGLVDERNRDATLAALKADNAFGRQRAVG